MVDVSLKELIESGAHYGHQSRRWNPKMAEYLHGVEDDIHIFDLIKTKEEFEKALVALTKAVGDGKKILLVGTKKQAKERVRAVAEETATPYVNERWLGGTLTNFEQVKKSTKKLVDMKAKLAAGEYKKYTKKERVLIEREITRLERFFGGMVGMDTIPDLIFLVDVKREQGAVKEANMKGVTTIAIVDSNCDPDDVTYPIPMNDDATRALEYALDLVREAILEGQGKKMPKLKIKTKSAKKEKSKPDGKPKVKSRSGSASESKAAKTAQKVKKNSK